MLKILFVISAQQPQLSSPDFACRIAALTQSKVTGLFIENVYNRDEGEALAGSSCFQAFTQEENDTAVQTNTEYAITLFVRESASHNIKTDVVVNKGEPIQEVLRESRYADLLILNPGLNFYGGDEQLPSHFTKEILANAECPVLLAPERATDMDEVIFCYDRSASSVYALKQFTYLLPACKDKKALLLEVKHFGAEDDDGDHQRVLEWLQAHYSHVGYKVFSGDAKDQLFTYFFMKEKKLVVMGSYGRSALSNLFRRSAADSLIRAVDLPIFITHFSC